MSQTNPQATSMNVAEREAYVRGRSHFDNGEIDRIFEGEIETLLAIGRLLNGEPAVSQLCCQRLAKCRVIFN